METAALQATQITTEIPNEQGETESGAALTISSGSQARIYSQEELIEDARQLAEIIESTHPDPYINGGGKIAFHRRLHLVLNAIPEEGMTRDEFMRILRPFVAAVGDAHTEIWTNYQVGTRKPGGIPLRFGIVGESLYVSGVPREEQSEVEGPQ